MTKWYLPRNASQFNIQKSINIIYHTIKDQKKKKLHDQRHNPIKKWSKDRSRYFS